MAIKTAILIGLCSVAFVRPVWGLGLAVLLSATLFELDQYLTIPLPTGFLDPSTLLLLSVTASVALGVAFLHRPPAPATAKLPSAARNVLFSAVVPYVAWQTVCAAIGALRFWGTPYGRFSIRYILAALLPWTACYVLLQRRGWGERAFRILFWLALATAGIHVLLQAFNCRSLMHAAYMPVVFKTAEYAAVNRTMEDEIATAAFVRRLPQGVHCILFCAIFQLMSFILDKNGRSGWALSTGLLFSAALAVVVSRSLLLCFALGLAIALFLAARAGALHPRTATRTILACAGAVLLLAGYAHYREGFLALWGERLARLAGTDSQFLSRENRARGLDNLASLHAIADHPWLGLGTPRYPAEYSLRSGPPTDIHALLETGLVAGAPGILLSLRAQWLLLLHFYRRMKVTRAHAAQIAPLIAALAAEAILRNLAGDGSTLWLRGVLPYCILAAFTAELCWPAAASRV